jgi:hypothetical protein
VAGAVRSRATFLIAVSAPNVRICVSDSLIQHQADTRT